jgi:hypothetical protein
VPGPGELDGGEVDAEHPQPVTGELAGGRDPGAAAQIGHGGVGGQQARQLGDPSGVPADMLRRRVGRLAVVTR